MQRVPVDPHCDGVGPVALVLDIFVSPKTDD